MRMIGRPGYAGVTVQDADDGDTTTMVETLSTAADHVEAVLPAGGGIAEVVADKGYHRNAGRVCGQRGPQLHLGARSWATQLERPPGGA